MYCNCGWILYAHGNDQSSITEIDSLIDYKFYCFNGEPAFLYISKGLEDHKTAQISFLTMNWGFANFKRIDYRNFDLLPSKPVRFNEMKDICRILAEGRSFARVDLYEINSKIFFSEITFYPCSGLMKFEPDEYDRYVGKMLKI